MAINLAEKYEKKLAEGFALESVVAGNTNNEYTWEGVRGINLYSPEYQDLNDYTRTGTSRYGTPTEVQDTLQYIPVTKDRSFAMTIDKGNAKEQMNAKAAGKILRGEIKYKVVPEMDKYALRTYIDNAGKIDVLSSTPAANTVAGLLSDGLVHLSNKNVPTEGRHIYIGWTYFGMLRLSTQFMGVDTLANKILTKGVLGTFMGVPVTPVPDDYLKKGTSQCYFLITFKRAVVQPKKIQDFFNHANVPGINGNLLEGRVLYDAAVVGAQADGVYAAVAASTQQATVTFTYTAETATLAMTSSGATGIKYTLDGTDPRYSKTAKDTTSGGTIVLGTGKWKVKAVAMDDALFTSAVATDTERTVA